MSGNPADPAMELLGLPRPVPGGPVAIASQIAIDSSLWTLEIEPYRHARNQVEALRRLSAAAPGCNPFFGFESLSASVNRIDRADVFMMRLWERIGEATLLRLAFPFQRQSAGLPPLNVTRAWSHAYAPLGMPLVDDAAFEETMARFAELLLRLGPEAGDCLRFDDFPADAPHGKRFLEALTSAGLAVRLCNFSSRAALFGPSLRPGRASLKPLANRKRRHEFARQLRRLSEVGKVEFTRSGDFRDLALRLEEFLLLEAQGWKGRRRTSIHTVKRGAAYARQMVASFGAHGDAEVLTLRLSGRPIAALVLLRAGGAWYPWKTAFDEGYRAYSPGIHLMIEASRRMTADPAFRFADSLARQGSWMESLWTDTIPLATLLVAVAPGAAGAAAVERLAGSIGRRAWLRGKARGLLPRR
jgi:CelD/BcsL family acetyltransferase involved in cellulose biosynthesis